MFIPGNPYTKARIQDVYLTCTVEDEEYRFTWSTAPWISGEVEQYSRFSTTIGDIVYEHIEDFHSKESSLEERCVAVESEWFQAYKKARTDKDVEYIADTYMSIDIPEYSELLDEFFDTGIIWAYGMKFAGIAFLEIEEHNLSDIMYFTPEEVEQMFKEVAAFNKESDLKLSKMLAERKVHITHRV